MTQDHKPPEENKGKVANIADAKFKKARKERKTPPPPPQDNDGRPVIRLNKGKLHEILDHADAALGERDGKIFDHFGRMVRVTDSDEAHAGTDEPVRKPGAILLREVTVPSLCDRLARAAHWEKYDSRAECYVRADVPRGVAESLLARAGEWKRIPELRGFVEAPTLRDDATVFDTPGYDKQSRLFFVGSIPKGYTKPSETRADAEKAAEIFLDLFREVPTDSTADRSAILSAVLTALVRRILPSAPMVGITAPSAGTGKSLVADAISIIATGRRAAVLGLGKNEEEGDKRLHGALLAGDPVVSIDNIERPLFGDLLCQALTQPNIRIRPLGSTQQISTSTNTMLIATGNNLDIRGDLRRRVLLVRLDAKVERPETREFKTDLLSVVTQRRGELVTAALTMLRAYFVAGAPKVTMKVGDEDKPLTPFGSFEMWSKWCRAPVVWLGFPDPLLASESLRDQDPDLVVQRQLYTSWFSINGNTSVTAGQVIVSSEIAENAELRAALETICQERIAARRLGTWLRRHRGRVIDGIRLEDVGLDPHTKVLLWKMVKV